MPTEVLHEVDTSSHTPTFSQERSIASIRQPDERLVGDVGEPLNERLYRRMRFIRGFEEEILALFDSGLLNGTTHACIGQEADAVGVVEHLRPTDHVFSNHRCHGHFLARTGDAFGLLSEILGKPSGVCGGIGGSQHISAPGFKSNGILGGTVPAAAGIALANQLAGGDDLSVVFVGDGMLGEGIVYETLNIASLWHLPLLVVVENNGWAQSTPSSLHLAGAISSRFAAFGIAVDEVDTTDVLVIRKLAGEITERQRQQGGPAALVIHTYRLCHHSRNDDNRPRDEVLQRWKLDPLRVHGERLTDARRDHIDLEVDSALRDLVAQGLRP